MIGVGSKILTIAAVVLGVGLILYLTIQSAQEAERDKITIEILEETQEKREAIDEAIKKSKPVNRNDATDSLQYLRDRKGN